ncbi:MAG: DNA gyrase inhibitor YacG [Idiomarina sp.]|nr:DNA gyrase inhibitor YacG [Idiomarina sp.]
MTQSAPIVKCPTCQTPVVWTTESTFRPFCSERCKLIDLGAWASEDHAIPGPELPPSANESSEDWQD